MIWCPEEGEDGACSPQIARRNWEQGASVKADENKGEQMESQEIQILAENGTQLTSETLKTPLDTDCLRAMSRFCGWI